VCHRWLKIPPRCPVRPFQTAFVIAGWPRPAVFADGHHVFPPARGWSQCQAEVRRRAVPSAVRRGIFVEIGIIKFSSSVGAAYSGDVAPTELDSLALTVLQRFQSYGLRRHRTLRATKLQTPFAQFVQPETAFVIVGRPRPAVFADGPPIFPRSADGPHAKPRFGPQRVDRPRRFEIQPSLGQRPDLLTERGSVTRSGLIGQVGVRRLTEPRSEIRTLPSKSARAQGCELSQFALRWSQRDTWKLARHEVSGSPSESESVLKGRRTPSSFQHEPSLRMRYQPLRSWLISTTSLRDSASFARQNFKRPLPIRPSETAFVIVGWPRPAVFADGHPGARPVFAASHPASTAMIFQRELCPAVG
jgi:hypothetical protein